jgi:hypothetical protein
MFVPFVFFVDWFRFYNLSTKDTKSTKYMYPGLEATLN